MHNFDCELVQQKKGKPNIRLLIEMDCGHILYHEISLQRFNEGFVNSSLLVPYLDGKRFSCDQCDKLFHLHSDNIPQIFKNPEIAKFLAQEWEKEKKELTSKLP